MIYEKEADKENLIRLIKSSTYNERGYKHSIECIPHFHEAKEFLFIVEGEQNIWINGEFYSLTAGDIYFTDSFLPHVYEKSNAEGYVLLIRDSYFHFFDKISKEKVLPNVLKDKNFNAQIFSIIEEWYSVGLEDVFLNVSYVYKIISKIVSGYGIVQKVKKKQDDVIQQMLGYVESHYKEDISLTSMSQYINYSAVYCSKVWHKYIKEPFRDYVNGYRIRQINKRIATRDRKETILQIAMEEGFESSATFYRAWKKVFGSTPQAKE